MIGYTIDLVRLHQLYERNFAALLKLFPECLQEDHLWVVVGASERSLVHFEVKQRSAYTTYLSITVGGDWGKRIALPNMEVRLYHDLNMAEVVFSHHSRTPDPLYAYPNPKMHQPNEKESVNQFLLDLIRFCDGPRSQRKLSH